MNYQVVIPLCIGVAAICWAVGHFAYWRGWSAGRQEEREGWSLLLKKSCRPPQELDGPRTHMIRESGAETFH